MEKRVPDKKKSNLLKEEKQLNFFLKDLLTVKNDELEKTKTELIETKQLHTKTNSKLFDIQQQNEFLKDIRVNLDSKVKIMENSLPKIDIKLRKNKLKTKTDKMFYDQQIPLLSLNSSVNSLKYMLGNNFNKTWVNNFKNLEDCILLAKLQVEEIVEYTEKEKLV